MTARPLTLALALGAALGLAAPARAALLYDSPPMFPGTYNAHTSQVSNGTPVVYVFDAFVLPYTATVTDLTWQGLYVSNDLAANPPPPVATSFAVYITADNAGLPGTQVFLGYYDVGAGTDFVQETFNTDIPNFLLGFQTQTTAALYDYSLTLSSGITLAGGTTYWLNLVAYTPTDPGLPFWGWTSGGDGTGTSFRDIVIAGTTDTVDFDRAFSLSGVAAVPEPASVALLAAGGLGLLARRRAGRV